MLSLKFEMVNLGEVSLLLEFVRRYYEFDKIPFKAEVIRPALEELVRTPSLGRAWIFKIKEEAIGYAIITFGFDHEVGGRQATITDFYIDAGFRGQGIGKEALRHIESECFNLGLRALELQVEHNNADAQRLYQNMGFESHSRIPMSKIFGGTLAGS